jgi:hypothetical protein
VTKTIGRVLTSKVVLKISMHDHSSRKIASKLTSAVLSRRKRATVVHLQLILLKAVRALKNH